jgi:hypothetical protein
VSPPSHHQNIINRLLTIEGSMDTSHAASVLLQTLEEIRKIACSDSQLQLKIDKISELACSTVDRYRVSSDDNKSSIRVDKSPT